MPTLRRELRQGKPFASLEEMVFLSLLRTGDALLEGETALLKTAELSFAQYNVLRILRGAGPAGLACGEIAGRMVNRDPDITRLLDRLESRGLVSRTRDEGDRRVVLARITAEGLAMLQQLDAPIVRLHRAQLAHLSRKQLRALAELLELARTPPR
ncbi:MAG: MarR family transcriptional regulator [Gemmatimonadales bacterium]|nr:MarR family transcriptional regulator [Gemmatimonadales bacterium]MDQ3426433.1 MarR family transcriptional regulator [Gemmatimonadota bacterium]